MPTFEIPESFGTEEEYRQRITEKDLFDEFTQDENGNVVLSQEDAEKKIKRLGGYDKLYRIKFEADYLEKLTMEGALKRYGDPLSDEVKERLKFELYIMKTMGFPGYFLIVQDFINTGREKARSEHRPRPRFGRRFSRGLLSWHHSDRPYKIRPPFRTIPES